MVAVGDVVIEVVPVLSLFWLPVCPIFTKRLLCFLVTEVEFTEIKLLHVGEGCVSGVVHHHIPNHADTFTVSGVDEGSKLVFGPHVVIELGPILVVVAMVSVVLKVTTVATANPAMNLL